MADESAGAAPAPTPDPAAPPLTAVEATLTIPDADARTRAFRAARGAERQGKPLEPPAPAAPVASAAATPPAETEARKLSRRQQEDNERTRKAVDAATADLQRRIKELETGRTAPPAAAPQAPAPAAPRYPTYAEALALTPDLAHEDYLDLRADWRAQQKQFTDQRARFEKEHLDRQVAIATTASERYAAAVQADPTFEASLSPELMAISTREKAIADKIPILPEHDFATALLESEAFPQLLRHISAHPTVLAHVRTLDSRAAVVRYFGRLEAKFLPDPDAPAAAPPPAETPKPKTLTTASDPPVQLGARPAGSSDPIAAAMALKDDAARTRAFRAAKLQTRLAAQGR